MKKPTFLIMDEATAGLDSKDKEKIYKIIKKNLSIEKNYLIIYTDHDPTPNFMDYTLTVDEYKQIQLSGEDFFS